jgi:hypothetical protein
MATDLSCCETSAHIIFEKAIAVGSCPAYVHSPARIGIIAVAATRLHYIQGKLFAPSHVNAG